MPHTILVVEDDHSTREVMERILRDANYRTVAAASGRQVPSILASDVIDLVITDLVMPDKDGIEVILDMRKRHRHIPVVAISGWGSQSSADYLQTARMFGTRASIEKPFTSQQLLHTVRSILGPNSGP